MKCLSNEKIIRYLEHSQNSMEYSLTRDHILSCEKCQNTLKYYELLESGLQEPECKEPPVEIEKNVMKKLFPRFSHIASLFSLIAASFMLLIAGIYIYFDFANDSMIRAFILTKDQATSVISGAAKFISAVFSGLLTIFKAVNTLLEVILNVKIGVEITGIVFALFFILTSYFVYNKIYLKFKGSNHNS